MLNLPKSNISCKLSRDYFSAAVLDSTSDFQVGQPFREVAAHHFVDVHYETERFTHEAVLAIHRPGHEGVVAFLLEAVKSTTLVAVKGLVNSSLRRTRSFGWLSVMVLLPSPALLLPDQA